jgi:enterochelin esterase-like enzyme
MSHDDDITWNWPDNAYGVIQTAGCVESRIVGETYGYGLYLPPSYASTPQRRYPVLYWLHGYTSRPHYAGYFTERLDAAIARGEAPEIIVIGVNGLYSALFCDDVSGARPVERMIMEELIPHVDATYRTLPHRESRGLEGFSRGGFGAAHLAFKYPEQFGLVSMLAGAFHRPEALAVERPVVFHNYFGGDQARWEAASSYTLATHLSGGAVRPFARMVVGDADHGQYQGNLLYHDHLLRAGISCDLVVVPGVDHTVRGIYDHYTGNPFAFFRAFSFT